MGMAGRTVLITGAARGIGRELVRAFLARGDRIVAADVSWTFADADEDEVAFDRLTASTPEVLRLVMDIAIDSHVVRARRKVAERFGSADVIINNGGMRARDLYPDTCGMVDVLETEVGDWQRMFDTHVFGTLRVIKAFVPAMIEQGRGSIVNVGTAGQLGNVGKTREGPYQPAKAAMHNMTLALAEELRDVNIAANVLCPGHTHTTGSDRLTAIRFPESAGIRPKRLRPDSVVPLALHLADQGGSGVTGQVLSVLEWNESQGLGGFDAWGHPPDIEEHRAAEASVGKVVGPELASEWPRRPAS